VLSHSPGTYIAAVTAGLYAAAGLIFLLEIVRQTCREGGLGIAHLGWPKRGTLSVERYFTTAALFAIPAVFVVSAMQHQPNENWQVSLGRLAFMTTSLILGIFAYRVFRPSGPLMQDLVSRGRVPWLKSLRKVLYLAAIVPTSVIVLLAASGFYFVAIRLAPVFGHTIRFGLVLLVINSAILRWMLFARRRLAIQRALDRRKEQLEADKTDVSGTSDVDGELVASSGAAEIGLSEISEQNRRLLRGAVLLSFGVGVWYIWQDVLPAFRIFDSIELWSVAATTTEQVMVDGVERTQQVIKMLPITLGSVIWSCLIVVGTVTASRNLPGFLELSLLQHLPFDAGQRYAVTAVSKYLIVSIGLVAAFSAIGIGWSQVQWLIAAMTVGLGFGLQEIFANFISGLIILLERPIRVGDTVTIENITGRVCRIQIRATTILDWDRKELIVPNKSFITNQLINWSLSDPILRLTIPVGIAYGSDTALAENVLMDVAAKNEFVLEEPASQVVFNEFGDSSLTFQLRVFISSIETYWRAQHSLHMQIDQAFRDRGIEIAFPQRDLHLRSVTSAIPVTVEPRS
jgi:potassium efflux system protein